MRKTAELLSLAALAALAFIAINIFYGPRPLPDTIPVHFDAAGHVNGWGSRGALLFMPIFAVAMYLFLSLIARFPSMFNYPVKVTDLNRESLERLSLELIAWLKAEIILFSVWMEFLWVQAVRHPGSVFGPYPVFVFVGVLFATIIGFIVAMFRAAKTARQQAPAATVL